MEQATAVWFIIALALVSANLPFVIERPLLALPWQQAGGAKLPAWRRWLESLVFFVLLVAFGYFVRPVIGKAVFAGSDPVSVLLFMLKLVGVFVVAFVLLSYEGWRGGRDAGKPEAGSGAQPATGPGGATAGSPDASQGLRGKKARKPSKSFFDRLLEVLVLYALVGMLGFGFETNIGNPFVQGWEFYAVTLCLFLVLAYPGFVYRYQLRGHGHRN
jgi:hypothetical protein